MIAPIVGHVIALGTTRAVDLIMGHAVDPATAGIVAIIDVAVPPMIIFVTPLVIGPGVVPGVKDVHAGLLGIGLGVVLGLALPDTVLLNLLAAVVLDVSRLGLLLLLRLLWIYLLLRLHLPMIVFLSSCATLLVSRSLRARLSQPPIQLLVFILREEYFRTPPGGANRVRLTTISLLQELRTHQEAMGVVIVLAQRDPAAIVPILHDLANITMITM